MRVVMDYARFGLDIVWGLSQFPRVVATSPDIVAPDAAQRMVLGLNVAGSGDPDYDDVAVRYLRLAGIRHVRMAWSPSASGQFTERLLQRLLDEEFLVMVTLLPELEQATVLARDANVQQDWRVFVRDFLSRYGDKVECLEIGNAPNRPKWSGYTPRSYLTAWRIATEEADSHGLSLAGPNISDFEPLFNIAYLRSMRRNSVLPSAQTDNLFVERAVEPEAYDASAMGKTLKNVLRLNLAKKIYVLADIAQGLGVTETYCTYTCWTRARLARWTNEPENKGADYLARYMLIAAATGRMNRLYWGPLVDARDGLIDCGSVDYPKVDNVAHYQSVRGPLDKFQVHQVFWTFKYFSGLVQNNDCKLAVCNPAGLQCLIFSSAQQTHHVYFSKDRLAFNIHGLYANSLNDAAVNDVRGRRVSTFVGLVGESPTVLTWQHTADNAQFDEAMFKQLQPVGGGGVVHILDRSNKPVEVSNSAWHGVVNLSKDAPSDDAQQLAPEILNTLPAVQTLRDNRNKLWIVKSPVHPESLVVKLNRATGARRISYIFRRSKGRRHWNNASEMLRRGVATPKPIAFFERETFTGVRENYYVCEFLPDAFTARNVFSALSEGADSYQGIDKQTWLATLAAFVGFMHQRKIVHRDLSAGNLMIQLKDGVPVVSVIDIGRAAIDSKVSMLRDLQRICFKLNWSDREAFVAAYHEAIPWSNIRFWRAACHLYDLKLTWKRIIKGQNRRK